MEYNNLITKFKGTAASWKTVKPFGSLLIYIYIYIRAYMVLLNETGVRMPHT